MSNEDRAVSVTLEYILMLMMGTVILTSVVFISAELVDGQLNHGTQDELSVSAERLAADLESAERLSERGKGGNVILNAHLPQQVGTSTYGITIDPHGEAVVLTSNNPEHEATVPVDLDIWPGQAIDLRGGPVQIHIENGELDVKEQ